ncbi:hypothetical protein ACFVFI_39280, partial [Streptomyces sp. NPDC057705]|uniref:hypothetical protein n=1 Tax=Streptomyces sp. NPDC057705 TaxID=3346222 RepID=UPI00369FDC58
ELWPPSFGAPIGKARDYVSSNRYEDESEIVEYLLSGHDLFSVIGSSADVLGSGKTVLGGDSIFSDGIWIWRGDLWFYVRAYHIRLPSEFLTHMRRGQYLMPEEDATGLRALAQQVHDRL